MSPDPFSIATARLRLRPLEDHDAAALVRIATPAVARNLVSIPLRWSEVDARNYIAGRRWRDRVGFLVGIEMHDGLVGGIGLGGTPVSLMYFLEEEMWGQGLTTEALMAFLPVMMNRFDLEAIVADHFVDNPASGRVLEKVGFRRTGSDACRSAARVEPCRVVEYRLERNDLQENGP